MATLATLAAAAALLAAPPLDRSDLPVLPPRGLAEDTSAGVVLRTMSGRAVGVLRGLDLASDRAVAHQLVLRDRNGRLFVVDRFARKVRRFFEDAPLLPGCRLTDARHRRELHVCRRVVWQAVYGPPGTKRSLRAVARAPGRVGHWVWAAFSPTGRAVLAQWSAECEVPVAYLVARGKRRAYGGESVALGWLPSGEAVIHFPNGSCAGTPGGRGIYAVGPNRSRRLLLRTRPLASYGMWGG